MWYIQAVDVFGHPLPGYLGTSDQRLAESVMDRLAANPLISVIVATYVEKGVPPIVVQCDGEVTGYVVTN